MNSFSIVILQNIISPYKTLLFNQLAKGMDAKDLKILYLAETESNREWRIDKDEIKFPFDVICKGKINYLNSIKISLITYKKLNFYDPEIVIIGGYSYLAFWAALIWVKKNKRKVILINESHYLDRPRYARKECIKKLFISNCHAALVDGIRHRDYLADLGLKSEKIFIKKGTGPVDISYYQEKVLWVKNDRINICNKLGIPNKNFLFVGRFSPEKNIIYLLKAYKRLKNEGADGWGLILVGNGPQMEQLNEFIKNNKIKDVYLSGFKQKEDIPFYYGISDVLILPSISEPWGLVVSEAMACGLPILVSNSCGCYPDIVHDGVNGFSFDPLKEDELFYLMMDILQVKYDLEAMGRASLEIIREYTPENMAAIFVEAIEFVKNEIK